MNGYERRKELKKEAIKQAAFSLFQQQGVKETKIEEIAESAGVSQVTIYNHFGSKEALLREIVKEYSEKELQHFLQISESHLPFSEKVKQLIFHKSEQINTLHPEIIQEAVLRDEELKHDLINLQQKKALPAFLKMIHTAQEKQEINPEISEESILIYFQMFQSQTEQLTARFLQADGKRIAFEMVELFFFGLSGSSSNNQ